MEPTSFDREERPIRKPIKRPLKAIRAFCLKCCGGNAHQVRLCSDSDCDLLDFRFGRNPHHARASDKLKNRAGVEQ